MTEAAPAPDDARGALAALGVRVAAADVHLAERGRGWIARLPGDRLAWFAGSDEARAMLARERRVLGVVAARCRADRVPVPRVLAAAPDGACDVRTAMLGACDPLWLYTRVRDDADAAARFGASAGSLLGELHAAVPAADVAGWLPRRPEWPEPRAWAEERLPEVVDDRALYERCSEVFARYEALTTPDTERVLAHGDFGFHNLTVDPATLEIRGLFDWEEACWGDPCHDFRYLVCNVDCPLLLDAALGAYERRTGWAPSRERIALEHAAVAVTYLAFRAGVPPEERWCGRTLAEDLAWTRRALARVLDGAAWTA